MTVMGRQDAFAAFLKLRPAAKPSSRQQVEQRLERVEGDLHDGLAEVSVPEVDRFEAKAAKEESLEENPFTSFLHLRPPKKEVPREVAIEQDLRQQVLKTKKELLEVALCLELKACEPETPEETALRLRRLQKAHRYLLHPERTMEALSGSEDEDSAMQNKIVCQSPTRAKVVGRADDTRRWSMGMMRRQPPPNVFTPSQSRPSTVYQDEVLIGQKRATSSSHKKKERHVASAPDLKAAETTPLPPLCKQKPMYKTWQGELVVDEASLVSLSGWYWKTRSWNMHIFRKDQGAARRMPEMAAGGVLFGNGTLPLFSGAHLMSTGYFYSFKVDAVDDQHFPLDDLRDLSLAFGVSFLPGGHRLCKNTMYAYEIPGSILIGYGKHVVDSGEWFTHKAWDPKSLEPGDVVGLLVSPHGDLVVYVNGAQVLRVATSLTEGNRQEPHPRRKALGPRRSLFPLIDLHGRVTAITMLHGSAPNVSLLARNRCCEKNLNPLGFQGKKAFPIPGRSLPGLGKVVPDIDALPGYREI